MTHRTRLAAAIAVALVYAGPNAAAQDGFDLLVNGQPWLRTVPPAYDESAGAREDTYKVYTHVYDFDGATLLTKGSGGLYTHHRGLFIGWMQADFGGEPVDSWHMRGCYQTHVEWLEQSSGDAAAKQVEVVEWRDTNDAPFIRETRTIAVRPESDTLRIIDFQSILDAVGKPVELRGDSHHAGMQIRLADEVSKHQKTTTYTLPTGAETREDDEVGNAWWAACNAEIGGIRYTVIHMTPPDHPTGIPVYSIRPYARFGAFFEPDLIPGTPLELNFRIVVSKAELDPAACQSLYDAYAAERTN